MPKKPTTPPDDPGDDNTTNLPAERPVTDTGDALMQRIANMQDRDEAGTDDVAESIILRYLHAETVDDVLAPQRAVKGGDIIGQPFTLHAVRFNESTVEGEGPDMYAVLEAVLNGKACAITCGSRNVMAQAIRLQELGALPLAVKIEKLPTKTRAGFQPLFLEAASLPNGGDAGGDEEPF